MLQQVARSLALAALGVVFSSCGHARTPPSVEASPLTLEASLQNRFVKSGSAQAIVARVGLAARKRRATTRPPVNLALLVDTSGSMEGRAIVDARAASLALLDSLTGDDRLAVVVFDSKAQVLLPSTRLGDADVKELRTKVAAMRASGTTDLAGGLRLAIDEVSRELRKDGVNRVVLVGDGVPNDDQQILPLVAQAASKGVSITSLGLGNDYDETLMGRIAQLSGGRFFYVEDSAKVASFFAEEVSRLHRVVARNAVLELRPGPGVTVQRVVGRPARGLDRGVAVELGDLSLGEGQEVVVELAVSPAKEGANVEVLDAVVRFEDGFGGALREERVFVGAKSTQDATSLAQGKSVGVEEAFERAKDAALTIETVRQQRDQARGGARGVPPPRGLSSDVDWDKPPRATPAAPPPASEELLRRHDRAMRTFQAN
jgi:Ca-activated chloride channel homolog